MAKNPYYDDGSSEDATSWDNADSAGGNPKSSKKPRPEAPALPEWAQIAAEIPSSEAAEPEAKDTTAVSPYVVSPQRPAAAPTNPTVPLPAAAPVPPTPVPVAPVPAPAPPPPAPTPPPEPVVDVSSSLSDLAPRESVPEYAPPLEERPRPSRKSSDRPDFMPTASNDFREDYDPRPRYAEEDEDDEVLVPGKKKGGFFSKGGGKKSSKDSKESQSRSAVKTRSKYAGGRWRVLALRIAVWVVIGIVGIAGVRAILFPPAPNIGAIAQRVAADYSLTNFPDYAGQALAVQFTDVYLNINPEYAAERTKQLTSYLASAVNADWAELSPQSSPQVVCSGPYIIQPPEVFEGPEGLNATYLVGAQVAPKPGKVNPCSTGAPGEWVYLGVTVFSPYKEGGLVIGGQPGFVPAPEKGTLDGAFRYTVDQAIVEPLTADLTNFFTAWGASDEAGLKPYVTDNATRYVLIGMSGTVKFEKIENVSPEKIESPTGPRFTTVDVTWSAGGNVWVQAYRLQVIPSNNVWQVADLYGGGFGR